MAEVIALPDEYWVFDFTRVKTQIFNVHSHTKSGDMMRFALECTLTSYLAAREICMSELT